MTDQHCTHHFEHVKQTRPFTEREYMQCTKCGLRNPLGLFQHWDTHRDGPAVKWPPRDNGGKLPAGLTPIINTTGKREHLATWDEYLEAEKQRQYGLKLAANYIRKKYGPKRKPYMTIRRLSSYGGTIGVHRVWCVHCTKCEIPGTKKPLIFAKTSTWQEAITTATRHARNHH